MANKTYNKHAVLAYLFDIKTNCGTQHIGEDIDFTLREVGEGIRATGGATPTSWSNFVLDLTRKRKHHCTAPTCARNPIRLRFAQKNRSRPGWTER